MTAERRPMTSPPDEVTALSSRHVAAAGRVVATALADDPGYRFLLPDADRRVGQLTALYRMTLADTVAHGSGFVTLLGPVVTGALATYPPGHYPMTSGRWARSGLQVARIAGLVGGGSRALIRFGRLTASAVPPDAWYFQVLGIRPDLQHTGRGAVLLRAALALVDAAGVSSYLETNVPANVTYYERFGYVPIREPVPLAPDGPWIYPMSRPAQVP